MIPAVVHEGIAHGATCPTGKRTYRNRHAALRAKDNTLRLQRKYRQAVQVSRVYRCPHCNKFHMTSNDRRAAA